MQICALLTRIQCKVSDTQVTVKACGPLILYYIDIHMVHEREKCTPLRSYIPRAVNVGAELNVNGNVS